MVSRVVLSVDIEPLVRSCRLTNSSDSIVNIDVEAFCLIVNVSKHNLAVTIKLDLIKLQVQFILDEFGDFHG